MRIDGNFLKIVFEIIKKIFNLSKYNKEYKRRTNLTKDKYLDAKKTLIFENIHEILSLKVSKEYLFHEVYSQDETILSLAEIKKLFYQLNNPEENNNI
jgi:hypothetical protein